MTDALRRLSFPEARALCPDQWVVFSDARIDIEAGEFLDGLLSWHGPDQVAAYEHASTVTGPKAIFFTGDIPYRTVTLRTDEIRKAAA